MNVLNTSVYLGAFMTIATYQLGLLIHQRFKIALFNPLLISVIFTIAILLILDIDYDTYNNGAKYLSFLLTPTTICLAIPLYEQFNLLIKHWNAILLGIISGVLTNLVCVFLLAMVFRLNHQEYVTLLPRSVTTAIGIAIVQELGGYVTITVAVIIMTGIFGNILAESICRIFKVEVPIAKGIAIGTASHAIGTTKALEMGEIEGAMSGLSIALTGILTVFGALLFSYLI